jgi:hypothetical protein
VTHFCHNKTYSHKENPAGIKRAYKIKYLCQVWLPKASVKAKELYFIQIFKFMADSLDDTELCYSPLY